jgi:hypothetical protein
MADAVEEGKAMRKDEELEAEAAAARIPEDASEGTKPAHTAMDMDEDLKDNELLGESTLAKLTPAPAAEEAPVTDETKEDSEEEK